MNTVALGGLLTWFTEPLSEPFMQRVLLGAVLAVVTTSLVGTWVVLRGLTFMGDALAHGMTPGIAVAFVLGINLVIGGVVAALVMVAGINLIHRRARLREDTGIGLLFVGMLALGVIIMSRLPSFTSSLAEVLFGDALGIRWNDVALQAIGAAFTLIVILVLYRSFLALSFNEEKAQVLGLHPRAAHFAMLTLLALAIVVSFKSVGILLVFGLLVAPPAAASLIVRRVPTMMVVAVGLGIVSVVAGLLISWHADTSAGATMAGAAVAMFFVVMGVRDLQTMWASLRRAAP
jgi:ABC-type Mn2+/Zn2+ transport system permease subunit